MGKDREGALAGYTVLDLTDSYGAYCGKLLADLGARVVKIEGPQGDPGRYIPPFVNDDHHPDKSFYFIFRNFNKLGVTLDLENHDERSRFQELVRTADIMVDNFPPGYMAGLGLGYEALREINPNLITSSITEFGQSGPYKDYKGCNLVDYALSGSMISSGFPDGVPCLIPGTLSHDAASLCATISILAALYVRHAIGGGQHVETSVHECARACFHPWTIPSYIYSLAQQPIDVEGGGKGALGDVRNGVVFAPVYPCRDGFIRVSAYAPRQWEALVRILGNPEVLLMPEWQDLFYRVAYANDLYALMLELTTDMTMAELFEAGIREGVPIAPVLTVADFHKHPNTKDRGFFVEVEHPVAGKADYPGPPYKYSETPLRLRLPAPLLGEHNESIFGQDLNYHQAHQNTAGVTKAPDRNRIAYPLEGVRVLTFDTGAAIPDFGKVMGELGADVIKIESMENLDMMRTVGVDKNSSIGFNESNRSKRSFGVNLKTEKGREIVRRLIETSDVIGENFRGGVMKSLGLDYESVRRINPTVIYLSSQGFGVGEYHGVKAYGQTVSAVSGMFSLWAHPSDPYPAGCSTPVPDHFCSKFAVIAVLAALDYRRRTGKGQFVDMAQIEVSANLIGEHYLYYTSTGKLPQRMGNRSTHAAPHGCYRCASENQWCAIGVFNEEEWNSFCDVIGNLALSNNPKFSDMASRLQHVEELDRVIEEWTATRDAHDVMEIMQAVGISAGVVQHADDTLADPQLKWDGALMELDHPVTGKQIYPNVVFRLSETPARESVRAPLFGEHTEGVCRELLRMEEDEINRLLDEGVLDSAAREERQQY